MVKIRQKNSREGQTSIDFLTGMTLFILTLLFALQFMFGMVQPYSSTAGESIQVADRASDRLYTDIFTSSDQPPGQFEYARFSSFFENASEDEIREALSISDASRFNITVSSDYTGYGSKDGLIAYWPLNERRSETARDIHGSLSTRLHGDVEGNVTTDVRGISSSGAYRFEDTQAAVNVSDDPALNPADTGNMTLSAWVRPEGSQPEFATVAAKGLNNGYQMHLDSSSGDNRYPTFEQGAGNEVDWGAPLSNGEWYHLVAVYKNLSSDNYAELYVNGDLKENDTLTIAAASGDNFGIGNNLQTSDRHFNGSIDEVRLYDRALHGDEVRNLYKSAGVLSPDKPDPGSSDTLVDTTYTRGYEVPSGQDIASVSSRKRVGYIGSRNSQRVEFAASSGSALIGDSLNEIRLEYPPVVDVSAFVNSCSVPCSSLTVGLDGDDNGAIDPGRDATADVNGISKGASDNVLEIGLIGNYNINSGDTIIAEFPLETSDSKCKDVDVTVNGYPSTTTGLDVCNSPERGSGIGTTEIDVKVW